MRYRFWVPSVVLFGAALGLRATLRLARGGGVGGEGAAQVFGIDRDRDAGALLLQQHGGTRVALVPAAVAFLASAEASYINGQTLFVDGGFTAAGMIARDVTARSDG